MIPNTRRGIWWQEFMEGLRRPARDYLRGLKRLSNLKRMNRERNKYPQGHSHAREKARRVRQMERLAAKRGEG